MRTLAELSNLTGKTILITGGSGHIARAAAEGLGELGARVALLDRDAAGLKARVAELKLLGVEAVAFPCDLESEAKTRAAARAALKAFGRLDGLIHLAAYTGAMKRKGAVGTLASQTAAAMEGSLRVNLTAAVTLVQECQKALEASRGSVILVSSIYGLVGPDWSLYAGTGMSNSAGYNAAKGGLLQLTRYLSTTLAPKVRVNALTPGGVLRGQPKAFVSRYSARTPLQRMAVEEDLKGAFAYLASGLSAYVTGQNLVVDGGWTAW
ncbi:MAG: SDR family oxidoreductase [Elusimicrobia bacterium]|nr:SDR family oxidoreductase [Elusimicrobiota bacterium]